MRMTKVIGDPKRFGWPMPAVTVTVTLGVLTLAAALGSQGCASKGRVAEVQPAVREAPPAETAATAPAETISPEAKTSEVPIQPAPAEQPRGEDDAGSPTKQEPAPPSVTAPGRPEPTSPNVQNPETPDDLAPREPDRAHKAVGPRR